MFVLPFVLGAYLWIECRPLSWAKQSARTMTEGCYASMTSVDPQCGTLGSDVRRATDEYGPVKSYRIVDVSQGFSNRDYTVKVDVERERGSTRETFSFRMGSSPSTGEKSLLFTGLDVANR